MWYLWDFQFYPMYHPDYYTLNEEQKKRSSGGYIFFNINKKALIKNKDQAMAAWRPDLPDVEEGAGPKSHVASFIGGKKRRRKRRRKSRRKTRLFYLSKTKRKSRKRRRKKKSKEKKIKFEIIIDKSF